MVKRFSPLVMLGLQALLCVLGLATQSAVARHPSCAPWPAPDHPALQAMQTCHAPPINRLLGDVCTEVRWLCGDLTIEAWLDRLMTSSTEEWIVHRLNQGLVFAQWPAQGDASTSLFWIPENAPVASHPSGIRIMVSRLRARLGSPFEPLLR
uniref:hypothetical protein n=1 Tax=Orrella sp. TaxID=1921583 RepID=UPI0040483174